MAKEAVKNKRELVILIETFAGEKFVLRRDQPYDVTLLALLKDLFAKAKPGGVALVSLRYIKEQLYNTIPASQHLHKITVQAIDGEETAQFLKDNKKEIASIMTKAAEQKGNNNGEEKESDSQEKGE